MVRDIGSFEKREDVFPGLEKVENEDLVGQKLLIKAFKFLEGGKGRFVVGKIGLDGKDRVFTCGGKAIVGSLVRVRDALKLEGSICEDGSGLVTLGEDDWVEAYFSKRKSADLQNWYYVFVSMSEADGLKNGAVKESGLPVKGG